MMVGPKSEKAPIFPAMSETTITPEMTMEAILQAFPSAQRALFQRRNFLRLRELGLLRLLRVLHRAVDGHGLGHHGKP